MEGGNVTASQTSSWQASAVAATGPKGLAASWDSGLQNILANLHSFHATPKAKSHKLKSSPGGNPTWPRITKQQAPLGTAIVSPPRAKPGREQVAQSPHLKPYGLHGALGSSQNVTKPNTIKVFTSKQISEVSPHFLSKAPPCATPATSFGSFPIKGSMLDLSSTLPASQLSCLQLASHTTASMMQDQPLSRPGTSNMLPTRPSTVNCHPLLKQSLSGRHTAMVPAPKHLPSHLQPPKLNALTDALQTGAMAPQYMKSHRAAAAAVPVQSSPASSTKTEQTSSPSLSTVANDPLFESLLDQIEAEILNAPQPPPTMKGKYHVDASKPLPDLHPDIILGHLHNTCYPASSSQGMHATRGLTNSMPTAPKSVGAYSVTMDQPAIMIATPASIHQASVHQGELSPAPVTPGPQQQCDSTSVTHTDVASLARSSSSHAANRPTSARRSMSQVQRSIHLRDWQMSETEDRPQTPSTNPVLSLPVTAVASSAADVQSDALVTSFQPIACSGTTNALTPPLSGSERQRRSHRPSAARRSVTPVSTPRSAVVTPCNVSTPQPAASINMVCAAILDASSSGNDLPRGRDSVPSNQLDRLASHSHEHPHSLSGTPASACATPNAVLCSMQSLPSSTVQSQPNTPQHQQSLPGSNRRSHRPSAARRASTPSGTPRKVSTSSGHVEHAGSHTNIPDVSRIVSASTFTSSTPQSARSAVHVMSSRCSDASIMSACYATPDPMQQAKNSAHAASASQHSCTSPMPYHNSIHYNDRMEGSTRLLAGKYEVQQVVGEGAYGRVMRCRVRGVDGAQVAVKEFKIEDSDPDADDVKRTSERELQLLQDLQHPCVVQLVDHFWVQDRLFIVMQYVPCNLLELLEAQPSGMDHEAVRLILLQLCSALTFIHDKGVLYRDIKPENLLVDEAGRVKLCDFGFARYLHEHDVQLTDYVATRWYRAPELLLGPPYKTQAGRLQYMYGQAVDLWAIGCLMGELIDGEPLFPGDSDLDQLYRIQQMLGPVVSSHTEFFSCNPHNKGIHFGSNSSPIGLATRYEGKMSAVELDFLSRLLELDPARRITAQECLLHPYLCDLSTGQSDQSSTGGMQQLTCWPGLHAGKGVCRISPVQDVGMSGIPEEDGDSDFVDDSDYQHAAESELIIDDEPDADGESQFEE